MKHRLFRAALIALALCLSASLSLADETQVQKAKQANAAAKAKAAAKKKKPPAPQVELVDINSASKDELKKLPGIGDADADKIIAGRPYLTKAHLQTHNIVSPGVYQAIQQRVVARQKDAKFAKDSKK
ncbi:MAG TPA: helix-hairpin-helix domain-containing protein [Ramlibacter sp.]|nr:helix-hairpin-helix domain-containing protein [Ramlibacter sp.]